jgi:hypothetical protein
MAMEVPSSEMAARSFAEIAPKDAKVNVGTIKHANEFEAKYHIPPTLILVIGLRFEVERGV